MLHDKLDTRKSEYSKRGLWHCQHGRPRKWAHTESKILKAKLWVSTLWCLSCFLGVVTFLHNIIILTFWTTEQCTAVYCSLSLTNRYNKESMPCPRKWACCESKILKENTEFLLCCFTCLRGVTHLHNI